MKKPIYGFYEPHLAFQQNEEFACANLWKTSWSQNGWEPTMLNATHSKAHKLHAQLVKKILEESKKGSPVFAPRYTRWCALSMAGGGWMSDYDTVNVGFTPQMSEELEKKAHRHLNTHRLAYVFYATKEMADAAILAFIENELTNDRVPVTEAVILSHTSKSLNKVVNELFHPNTSEPLRSEQMAEYVDTKPKGVHLVAPEV